VRLLLNSRRSPHRRCHPTISSTITISGAYSLHLLPCISSLLPQTHTQDSPLHWLHHPTTDTFRAPIQNALQRAPSILLFNDWSQQLAMSCQPINCACAHLAGR
jgi:hypothetical protein